MYTIAGVKKINSYKESGVVTYKADISEIEKNNLIKSLEDEIEQLQDEIDLFNAVTDLQGY